MKPILPLFAVIACVIAAPVSAQTQKPVAPEAASPTSKINAQTFVTTAASSNQFEILSSEMAKQRASDDKIKQFADQMIADHAAAGEKMKATLSNSNTTAPDKPKLQAQHQSMLDELSSAKDDDFDAAYLRLQTQAHNDAVKLFRTYSNSGDSPELVKFAKETLPIPEKHLEHVKALSAEKPAP